MSDAITQKVYPDDAIPSGGKFGGIRHHRGLDHSQYWMDRLHLPKTFTPWAAGEVVDIRRDDIGLYGRFVEVRDEEGVFWSYCHAKSIDDALELSTQVTFGVNLGVVGSSGTAAKAGSEHLHTMCASRQGAARNGEVDTVNPLPHIDRRLGTDMRIAAAIAIVFGNEGESDMFQFKTTAGNKYFVHPSLPVEQIKDFQWAINKKVGIQSDVDVPGDKARSFIVLHNARIKPLSPLAPVSVSNVIVDNALEELNLDEVLAGEVSDAVFEEVDKLGGVVDEGTAKRLAEEAFTRLDARRGSPPRD